MSSKHSQREFEISEFISQYPNCKKHLLCTYEIYENVPFDGSYKDVIISELVIGYNLKQLIDARRAVGFFKETELRKMMKRIIQGVQLLHKNGIAHRDLKLDNIMFNNRDMKVIDLGSGCFIQTYKDNIHSCKGFRGTSQYMAPELIELQNEISKIRNLDQFKIDNYALGVTFKYLMFMNKKPNLRNYTEHIFLSFETVKEQVRSTKYSEEIKDMVIDLMRYDPDDRISLEECLRILK